MPSSWTKAFMIVSFYLFLVSWVFLVTWYPPGVVYRECQIASVELPVPHFIIVSTFMADHCSCALVKTQANVWRSGGWKSRTGERLACGEKRFKNVYHCIENFDLKCVRSVGWFAVHECIAYQLVHVSEGGDIPSKNAWNSSRVPRLVEKKKKRSKNRNSKNM